MSGAKIIRGLNDALAGRVTRSRTYDTTDAAVFPAPSSTADPFDLPSQPQPGESDELEVVYRDLEDMTADYERLRVACSPIVAAWNHANDPGMSDLDAEQPVSLMLTKADWQRLWFAMRVKP